MFLPKFAKEAVSRLSPVSNAVWMVESEDQNEITSSPADDDKRYAVSCSRCGSSDKLIYSFLKQDHSGLGRKQAHYLYCSGCGDKFCELPHHFDSTAAAKWAFPFGKHKGVALENIPMDYLNWYMAKGDDEKIKRKIRAYLG